jgi:hypothetical protein
MVTMDEIDKEALTRALELTKAEPERAERLESMLKDRSWEEVAQYSISNAKTCG